MRSFLSILSILALAGTLQACRGIDLLDLAVPVHSYQGHRHIAYGGLPRQHLDIYVPGGEAKMPAPVIVFFYGGSWQRGAKEDYRFVGESFASRGYVTVIADYRLYPEVHFPGFVEDAAAATRWVRDTIGNYGGDVQNLYVAGHSAGAYNAVMLALDPRYLKAQGMDPRELRGVIGLSGPYDFLPVEEETITAIFANAPYEVSQPARFRQYDDAMPAVFLGTGAGDELVPPANTQHLAERLLEAGIPVETHLYETLDHRGVAQSLASAFVSKASVVPDIMGFMARTHRYSDVEGEGEE